MTHLLINANARRIPLADRSVDLVFGSPPYIDARLYLEDGKDLGIARKCRQWVAWMMDVTREAIRVSRGPVLWVVAGKTDKRNYQPGPEGLVWEWYLSGGQQECPCYWHRVGISGSGGDQWFRKDVEYVLAFKRDAKFPWSDNTAMGHPPKWAPGGAMSHRVADGSRVDQWGGTGGAGVGKASRLANGDRDNRRRPGQIEMIHTKRLANGDMPEQTYSPPAIANPGNYIPISESSSVVDVKVGGGHLGHPLAHKNEAPFPEKLAEHFIRSLCPTGGRVLDPFSGSGTTAAVADRLGRAGIGLDLRMSQCRLAKQRIERPHAPIQRAIELVEIPLFSAQVNL